jgi:hypothetical protein
VEPTEKFSIKGRKERKPFDLGMENLLAPEMGDLI